uniref:Uncharacterized protein n=1 Tax=Arundo donax TaxID=35708 RepID=A0A0A9GJ86_ARUDO
MISFACSITAGLWSEEPVFFSDTFFMQRSRDSSTSSTLMFQTVVAQYVATLSSFVITMIRLLGGL